MHKNSKINKYGWSIYWVRKLFVTTILVSLIFGIASLYVYEFINSTYAIVIWALGIVILTIINRYISNKNKQMVSEKKNSE